MDETLRRLERQAALGDPVAAERLVHYTKKLKEPEWLAAKEYLVDNPDNLEAWARYIAAAHDVGENPSLGDPYFRLLDNDIRSNLIILEQGLGIGYSSRDYVGRFNADTGGQGPDYLGVIVTHPTHPYDREKYPLNLQTRIAPWNRVAMFGRIRRDGNIDYWLDIDASRVIANSEGVTPNHFRSADELLHFFYDFIYMHCQNYYIE